MVPQTDPHTLLTALTELEELRAPCRGAGQRQFQRFVVRGDAQLYPMDRGRIDQEPLLIMLRDMSRGGIGFVCQRPIEQNELWRVGLMHHGHIVAQQSLIVRHCQRVQNSLFLVGGQFCIETGLMCLVGIDPAEVRSGDSPEDTPRHAFLKPGEA